MGVPPGHPANDISGLSWLGVEHTSNPPDLLTISQAQPDPNRVLAAAENLSLNASNEPKVLLIASARAPVGAPPPLGDMMVQKRE